MRPTRVGWIAVVSCTSCAGSLAREAPAMLSDGTTTDASDAVTAVFDANTPRDGTAATVDAATADASFGDTANGADADDARDAASDAVTGDSTASPPDAARSRIDAIVAQLHTATDVTAVEATMHDVAWHEGWPLHEGSRWLFVTHWSGAPASVALVGALDDWNPASLPAQRALDGEHVWVVVDASAIHGAAAGSPYKWWGAPSTYRAPSESRAYGRDDNGVFGMLAPPVSTAWVERFPDLVSSHLVPARTVRVRLPAGFTSAGDTAAHARTLLLHDGQNVFAVDQDSAPFGGWHVDDALTGALGDVVAIAVDNASDRIAAYTDVPDTVSGALEGGRASDYLALLDEDVLPFVRAQYGIVAQGRSLTMMGSSLGGYVSLYAALTSPTRQGCVAALSPTAGWGAYAIDLPNRTLARRWVRTSTAVYLDSGGDVGAAGCTDPDGDGAFEDADDSDNDCVTMQLRDTLASLGYAFGTDLFHWHEAGAQHNEAAWRVRVPRALDACVTGGWTAP